MRNKVITGAIAAVILLSASVLFIWYFSEVNISIVNLEAPEEIGLEELGSMTIVLRNNALKDINVTVNVKNAFVDEKGISLRASQIVTYDVERSNNAPQYSTYRPLDAVLLKPGDNNITVLLGYQVSGIQNVEVEVYQHGRLADSRAIEINVPAPKIDVNLRSNKGINGTDEVYTVYGYLENSGRGYAPGVIVNISVINETTNATVSAVTRRYSISSYRNLLYMGKTAEPLVVWSRRNSTYEPVTGMLTVIETETYAPIVVIELSGDKPSTEKYLLSPVVVKGRIGDRYRVVVTAEWRGQVASSEVSIPV